MKFITSVLLVCIVLVVALLMIGNSLVCTEHEMGKSFSFQYQNSTASSSIKPYCKKCNTYFGYTRFRGTPSDTSYLTVMAEHSDDDEIVGGEYYTMTAIVSLKFYESSPSEKVRINCKVEADGIKVGFSVEFREEFREQVKLLEAGDEVIFRGKYYDVGCGFTDAELITK